MSIDLTITEPENNAGRSAGLAFSVLVKSDAWPPTIEQGFITLQYCAESNGPWTTCKPIGETSDPINANGVTWNKDQESYEIVAQISEASFYRVAVFLDVHVEGKPEEAPSGPKRVLMIVTEEI